MLGIQCRLDLIFFAICVAKKWITVRSSNKAEIILKRIFRFEIKYQSINSCGNMPISVYQIFDKQQELKKKCIAD